MNPTTKDKLIMRSAFTAIFIMSISLVFIAAKSFEYNPLVTTYYTASGKVPKPTKIWSGFLVPTTASGQIIDISSAGFTTIRSVQILCGRNTTDPMLVPNVAYKVISTTQISVNITQGNNATVAILGINVLSGAPFIFAPSPSTLELSIIVTGD